MVNPLPVPSRPITGATPWTWETREPGHRWAWCRIYHQDSHNPNGVTHRRFGPILRLDHHTGDYSDPAVCPDGREILYVARSLTVALGEVFGEAGVASICPNYRVALVEPLVALTLVDLASLGTCMRIRALPSLGTGAYARPATQEWARALWEDVKFPGDRILGLPAGAYYQAAYSSGKSLALWNTSGRVRTVESHVAPQDFSLHEIKHRVVGGLAKLRLPAEWHGTCSHSR